MRFVEPMHVLACAGLLIGGCVGYEPEEEESPPERAVGTIDCTISTPLVKRAATS